MPAISIPFAARNFSYFSKIGFSKPSRTVNFEMLLSPTGQKASPTWQAFFKKQQVFLTVS
jgi:hypothetical protein